MVSGLMNWKQRSKELRSGTWNFFPKMVISTSFSYGRNGSDMVNRSFVESVQRGSELPELVAEAVQP